MKQLHAIGGFGPRALLGAVLVAVTSLLTALTVAHPASAGPTGRNEGTAQQDSAYVSTLLFGTLILDFMFDAVRDPRFGSLVTCLALFLIPTIFAGMVSPYAIRIIVKNKESSGHDAANFTCLPVRGWVKASSRACNICRGAA